MVPGIPIQHNHMQNINSAEGHNFRRSPIAAKLLSILDQRGVFLESAQNIKTFLLYAKFYNSNSK